MDVLCMMKPFYSTEDRLNDEMILFRIQGDDQGNLIPIRIAINLGQSDERYLLHHVGEPDVEVTD